MENKAWQECLDEAKEMCQFCSGIGYTAEHDPSDPHIDGFCSCCPIQVECHPCKAVGYKYNYQHAADLYAMRFLEEITSDGWIQAETANTWRNILDPKIAETERKTTQQLLEQFNNQEQ